MLNCWTIIKNVEPKTFNEILNQYLFDNYLIKIDSNMKKKVSYNLKIKDLLNNDWQFLNINELNTMYNHHLHFLDFNCISSSIPQLWTNIIRENRNAKYIEIADFSVKIKGHHKLLAVAKQKEIYWELINRTNDQTPTSLTVWHNLYPFFEDINWVYFRTLPYRIVREPYIQTLQYKILNRTLACKHNLYNWKIMPSPNCLSCGTIDTLEHYLFFCTESKSFWEMVQKWLSEILSITYKFTVCEVLGIIDNNDAGLEIINLILLMGKMHIYHSKQNNCPISLLNFLHP